MRFAGYLALLAVGSLAAPRLKHLSKTRHVLVLDAADDKKNAASVSAVKSGDCGCESEGGKACNCGSRKLHDAATPATPTTPTTPTTPAITDLTLLTVYKGHDESDRAGVTEYGDLIQDFRQGWTMWPTTNNVVNYVIDASVGSCEQSALTVALSVISTNSCLKFEAIDSVQYMSSVSPPPVIHISASSRGCFASLGYRNGGEHVVNIGAGCINVGTVLHLVMHALGFMHEHQRPDRDDFVQIVSKNVDPNRIGGHTATDKFDIVFGKIESASAGAAMAWSSLVPNKPYDYDSIMHNGACHYSVSEDFGGAVGGCLLDPTLVASPVTSGNNWGNPANIGNRATLSAGDAQFLNLLFCPILANMGGSPPITVSLLEKTRDVTPPIYAGPAAGDATTAETTICMVTDANDFEWTNRAATGGSSVSTSSGTSVKTVKPVTNPNEGIFKNFFREASNKRTVYIAVGSVAALALIGGVVAFAVHKINATRRKGLRQADAGAAGLGALEAAVGLPATAPLLDQEVRETGASTDSEIYADLLEETFPEPTTEAVVEVPQGNVAPPRGPSAVNLV